MELYRLIVYLRGGIERILERLLRRAKSKLSTSFFHALVIDLYEANYCEKSVFSTGKVPGYQWSC